MKVIKSPQLIDDSPRPRIFLAGSGNWHKWMAERLSEYPGSIIHSKEDADLILYNFLDIEIIPSEQSELLKIKTDRLVVCCAKGSFVDIFCEQNKIGQVYSLERLFATAISIRLDIEDQFENDLVQRYIQGGDNLTLDIIGICASYVHGSYRNGGLIMNILEKLDEGLEQLRE